MSNDMRRTFEEHHPLMGLVSWSEFDDCYTVLSDDGLDLAYDRTLQFHAWRLAMKSQQAQGEPDLTVWVVFDNSGGPKFIKKYEDGSLAIFDTEAEAETAACRSKSYSYKKVDYYSRPPAPAAGPEHERALMEIAAGCKSVKVDGGTKVDILTRTEMQSIAAQAMCAAPSPAEPSPSDKPDSIQTCPHCLYVHELQCGNDQGLPAEPERELEAVPDMDWLKAACTSFFYWWHNQPGSNTQQGFDGWLETESAKILLDRLAGYESDDPEVGQNPDRQTVDLVGIMAGALDSAARVGRLNAADTMMIGDDIYTLSQLLDKANDWLGEHNSVDIDEQQAALFRANNGGD